jgi:hypothetical protein
LIWRRSLWWQLLLLVGSGLLLVGIFQVWFGNDLAPGTSLSRKGPEVPKVTPLRDTRPLNAFAVVSSKSLFSQDRTGPDPGVQTAKTQGSLEGRTLLGTIIIGDERAALISEKAVRGRPQVQVQVVRQGEEWEGYKVVEISNEAVVFLGKEGRQTLNFPE